MKKILKTPKNPQKCKNLHIAPSQYLLVLFARQTRFYDSFVLRSNFETSKNDREGEDRTETISRRRK